MTNTRMRRAAAVTAVAGLLAACGRGGGGGGPALTHGQFVSKANALCRDATEKAKNLDPSSPDYIQKAIAAAGNLLAELKDLNPPATDAGTFRSMLDAFEKAIADVGKGDFKDAAAQQTTYVHAADKLGLSDCTTAGLGS